MKSCLVVGLGKFGKHFARKLAEDGHDVLAVDISEEAVNSILPFVANAQIGDATNEQFVESLGVRNFDLCVIAIGDDFQSSLEAAALIKDLGAPFVLARACSDVHKKFLLRNGADDVVYLERDMAERLAVTHGSDSVFDFIRLTPDYSIYEISVPSHWVGKSIVEAAVRTRYHVSIIATKIDGDIRPLPHADYVFTGLETIIIVGKNADVRRLM